jgi:hypothetical protein
MAGTVMDVGEGDLGGVCDVGQQRKLNATRADDSQLKRLSEGSVRLQSNRKDARHSTHIILYPTKIVFAPIISKG